jgi:hypothetical protein
LWLSNIRGYLYLKYQATSNTNNKELNSQLEKAVSVAIWIQTFGKVMEVVLLTKLFLIDEEARSDPNERQVVEGFGLKPLDQF